MIYMKIKNRMLPVLLAMVVALACIQGWAMASPEEPAEDEPIEAAFTDEVFLSVVRELVGKTGDEHIYRADVESITELVVDGYNRYEKKPIIESLNGIEYFTGLERLDCDRDELYELDLSHNPNLKEVLCYGNYLVALDVSHNPKLEFLDCSYNELESLDVTNCPELRRLDCNYTALQELDVSHNTKLTTLICYGMELRTLDISNNVWLEELDAGDGHLLNLDVSNNTRLKYLDCSYHDMCAVDCVKGLENCPELVADDTFFFEPQNTVRTGHDWDNGKVTTQPGCTEKGELTYTCINCGMTKTEEIPAMGQHTPEATWETDEINHWHTCTVCVTELDKADHIYDNDRDANCNTCGYKRAVTPPAPPAPSVSGGSSYSYYTITATAGEGGEIHPSGRVSVRENRDKDFTITPGEGYEIADVLVDGKSVGEVKEYAFENVVKAHTIEASFREAVPIITPCLKDENCPIWPFTDANAAEWYHDGVHYCIENGLMSGYGGGKFLPNAALTRGMLAQILYNKAGRPTVSGGSPFDDVASGAWYADAVAWAAKKNIVEGYGKGKFGPDNPITREQLVTMLYRYAGSPDYLNVLLPFDDEESISGYALDALHWVVENGIIQGKGRGILASKGEVTRAEAAAMLQRYLSM